MNYENFILLSRAMFTISSYEITNTSQKHLIYYAFVKLKPKFAIFTYNVVAVNELYSNWDRYGYKFYLNKYFLNLFLLSFICCL